MVNFNSIFTYDRFYFYTRAILSRGTGFPLIILGVISWGISIGLFDILIFRRGDTIKINMKRVGVYILIGFVVNYILYAYYVIYIPVSLLMFLTMAIYGGIKLFRKA